MAYVFPILFLKGIEIYGILFRSKESPKITWKVEVRAKVYICMAYVFPNLLLFFLKVLKFMANCVHLKNHQGTFGMYLVWKISQDFPAIG